jgi:predicted enzyme related to lactoylglutathione lyase
LPDTALSRPVDHLDEKEELLDLDVTEEFDSPEGRMKYISTGRGGLDINAPPRGEPPGQREVGCAIEVEDVETWYSRTRERGVPFRRELQENDWGRIFSVFDPNGFVVFLWEPTRSR